MMPTELLDLRLAFRALSDDDSDEAVEDTTGDDDVTLDDDELGDDDMNVGDGDDNGEDEKAPEE